MFPNSQAKGFRVGPSALPRSSAHPFVPIEKQFNVLSNYRATPRTLSAASDLRSRFWVLSAAAADVESVEKTESREVQGSQALELSRPVAAETEGHPGEQSGQEQATTSGQGAEKYARPAAKNWQRNGRTASSGRQNQRGRRGGNRGGGPVKDFPFKVGDIVIGQVIGGQNGWRVALEHDKNILGFCPHSEMPQILRHAVEEPVWNATKHGLRRPFQIKVIPEDMEYNGKGPLLSARAIDLDVLWKRAEQIKDVCVEDGEVITIHVNKLNVGGCLGTFEGLPTFVPFSFVPRMPKGGVKDREAMAQTYVGKDMQVSIVDVRRESNRFVGNMIEAMQNKAFNKLKVGDVVWGFVNAIEAYGAFITLDEHPSVRGLLHIASISRAHVDSMNGLFHVGEKVRSLVVGIDSNKFRVSLSTAELEPESGDMLFNKAKVYQHAEENVADFRQWVVQRQKEIESGEVEIEDVEEDTLDWNA